MASTYTKLPKDSVGGVVITSDSENLVVTPVPSGYKIGFNPAGLVAERATSVVNTYTAGETLSALKAVYEVSGVVYKADNTSLVAASVSGISLTAADAGTSVQILQFGVLQDPVFSFAPADLVFLTTDGTISNVAPDSGYLTRLGRAINANTLLVIIDSPKTL